VARRRGPASSHSRLNRFLANKDQNSMRQNLLMSQNGFVHICGHRGHNVAAPENTFAAFRAAEALGGTSLEIDTVLTRDGEIVVLHDLLVDRTTNGHGAVRDMTLAEVQGLDAGSRFDAKFAGERIPTLRETLQLARDLDLILEVEIKEKLRLPAFVEALGKLLADDDAAGRVVLISFDHRSLRDLKRAIPQARTAGIVHERFSDPVAVAKSSNLDELCIDLSVYEPEDARLLHQAGIAIRCHAYSPKTFDKAVRAGLNWPADLAACLKEGLIDTLSGDDVAWLVEFADRAGVPRRQRK
jgi:glycerophosphoryl diester phosphodiesterase